MRALFNLGNAAIALALFSFAGVAPAASSPRHCNYTAAPHSIITIMNEYGTVALKPAPGSELTISATPASDKVEVDCFQVGSRVKAVSHFLQPADPTLGTVDYQVAVPAGASVSVRNTSGSIHADSLNDELTLRSDAAEVDASNLSDVHLRIVTVSGPVNLKNIRAANLDVLSTAGDVHLTSVNGQKVSISTTRGNIFYDGDFSGDGDYSLANNSGNIDVTLPASASIDLDARSLRGSVENDFPLRQKAHSVNPSIPGRSFAGTSNSGSSSVELRSFSGTIRVKKR
jgi:DUF4097 and DUF4098 domain-containing protein YvlB